MSVIEAAQQIIDSTVDIRPEYRDKRVVGLWISPPTEALTVRVWFEGGTYTTFVGLWAKEITRHLPD